MWMFGVDADVGMHAVMDDDVNVYVGMDVCMNVCANVDADTGVDMYVDGGVHMNKH